MSTKAKDLSVTALYTSAVWTWGELPNAPLFATRDSQIIFRLVNGLLGLVRPFFSRLPSLRHSLLQRHILIDRLLEEARIPFVLEIASGLSRRGATYSSKPGYQYVEVDMPHVVERKRLLLARTLEGQTALDRKSWHLHGADASSLDLQTIAPGASGDPLFVIIEGLLMYLDGEEQRALFQRIAKLFADRAGGTLVFDLVPACEQAKPGMIGKLLERLFKFFTGGQTFIRDNRTRLDIRKDLQDLGFKNIELLEPQSAGERFSLPHRNVDTQQLVFVARY